MAEKKQTKKTEDKSSPKSNQPLAGEDTKAKKSVTKTDVSNVSIEALKELKAEFVNYKLDVDMGKQTNTAKLKQLRKQIARTATALRQKQVNLQKQA